MLLEPKRWKYRKQFVPILRGKAKNGYYVSFGQYGLKAVENGYVSSRQLESARKTMIRHVRKFGKIWFRVYPSVPFTKKGLEMPMGKGKGEVDQYKAKVKRGRILFEVSGLDRETMAKVFDIASKKLPIKTRMVQKGEIN